MNRLGLKADAVAARRVGENVQVARKSDAKAVELAKNSGDKSNMREYKGHGLPNGETRLPHFQTDGDFGHTFWGKLSALFTGVCSPMEGGGQDMAAATKDAVNELKSDPVGSVVFVLGAGDVGAGSDKLLTGKELDMQRPPPKNVIKSD